MTLKDNFVMSFCNRQILDLPAPKRDVPLCLSARMGLSWQRLHPTSHSPFGRGSAQQWVLISDGERTSGNVDGVQSRGRSGHVPWPQQSGDEAFPCGSRESRQTIVLPRSCQLGKRIQPAKTTEGKLVSRKPQAAATASAAAMCKIKPCLQ